MTTKQELLKKHEELIKAADAARQAAEELKEKIDAMPEKGAERQRAAFMNGYWYIDNHGTVLVTPDYDDAEDIFRFTIGNYFKSKEEAEQYKQNLITKQKLKDLASILNDGKEAARTISGGGYILTFGHGSQTIDAVHQLNSYQHAGAIYCMDSQFAEKAIKLIGEEALKQYILSGV